MEFIAFTLGLRQYIPYSPRGYGITIVYLHTYIHTYTNIVYRLCGARSGSPQLLHYCEGNIQLKGGSIVPPFGRANTATLELNISPDQG